MKIHEVMAFELVFVSRETPISKVWEMLFKKRVNALPVVDDKKRLQGIVTKEDLLKILFPDESELIGDYISEGDFVAMEEKLKDKTKIKAGDVMNTRVIFTRRDTPVMRALSRMILRSVNQLPVLSEADEVIGMVTKGDIFYSLFKKHQKREVAKKKGRAFATRKFNS